MPTPIIEVGNGEGVVVEVRNLDLVVVPGIEVGNARSPGVVKRIRSRRTWRRTERIGFHRARITLSRTTWYQSETLLGLLGLNLR